MDHPRCSHFIFPVDYGYLKDTSVTDSGEVSAIICIDAKIRAIYEKHNDSY